MSVVSAYAYKNGQRQREVSLSESCAVSDQGEFVWIGIAEPNDAEMAALESCFQLHPLAVADARGSHVRPRLEIYGGELVVNARTAVRDGDTIRYGNTAILVGADHIVTVRTGSVVNHATLRTTLEASPLLLRYGVDYVLYGILDFIIGNYLPIVESIEEDLLEMEHRALDTFLTRPEINRIFALRRELVRFSRLMDPTEEMLGRLGHLEHGGLDEDVRPFFRDVHDKVRRVAARVEGARESISSILEASSLLEQHRQGIITRQLAAWAAILAVPTAIAGIYGMNFAYMPELQWRYGYFAVLAVILIVAGVLFWRFRRNGWI